MNLFEYEGKELLSRLGIRVPHGTLFRRGEQATLPKGACFAKAQVLASDRAKRGGIIPSSSSEEARAASDRLLELGVDGMAVDAVLIEERIPAERELYVACLQDTGARGPVLLAGTAGGSGIESAGQVLRFPLDAKAPAEFSMSLQRGLEAVAPGFAAFCRTLVEAFEASDARQIEINPVAVLGDGSFVALDAKVSLDVDAAFRHPEWEAYGQRTEAGKDLTPRELAVRSIDAGTRWYQGTAGKYREMDGDVAVLFSGGGASIVIMDELTRHGLAAANYTEYSGNPPREKVRELARIVLSKPGLRGMLIAGGVANFTDIKETFAGIVDALDETRPSYPIVVRRAGPNEREGMELMRACGERNGLRMELHGKEMPMRDAVGALKNMMETYGHPA
jgi:citryl-CoA synthetase large subunit